MSGIWASQGLRFDANGNLIGVVLNQTDTLANLLSLAGGLGQIAKATDVDALVAYTGVQGQAKAYYRSTQVGLCALSAANASIPNITDTTVPFTVAYDPAALFTGGGGNYYVTAPAGTTYIEVGVSAQYGANTTGQREMRVQLDATGSGFWADLPIRSFISPVLLGNDGFASAAGNFNLSGLYYSATLGGKKLRIQTYQNSGGAISTSFYGLIRFYSN